MKLLLKNIGYATLVGVGLALLVPLTIGFFWVNWHISNFVGDILYRHLTGGWSMVNSGAFSSGIHLSTHIAFYLFWLGFFVPLSIQYNSARR